MNLGVTRASAVPFKKMDTTVCRSETSLLAANRFSSKAFAESKLARSLLLRSRPDTEMLSGEKLFRAGNWNLHDQHNKSE